MNLYFGVCASDAKKLYNTGNLLSRFSKKETVKERRVIKMAEDYKTKAQEELERARKCYNTPRPFTQPATPEVGNVRLYVERAGVNLAEIGTSEKELKKLAQWPRLTFRERLLWILHFDWLEVDC